MKREEKKLDRGTVYDPKLPEKAVTPNVDTQPLKIKDMHTIGKRLKYYREKAGLEQKQVAKYIGFTPNAISNWENSRSRPDITVIPKLCELLNTTIYELCGLEEPMNSFTVKEKQLIEDYRGLNKGHRYTVDKLIDTLKAVEYADECPDLTQLIRCDKHLAAGFDSGVDFDDEGEPVFIYTNDVVSRADYVFTVNGDSMEPEYHDGDMVLVQKYPGCPELRYGEVGAFIVGNCIYIKVYEQDGLHSLNENYDTMTFNDDDSVYLIGRVLGILSPDEIAAEADIERFMTVHGSKA